MARNWFDSTELYETQIGPENQKSMNCEEKRFRKINMKYKEKFDWLSKWLQTVPDYRRKYTNKSILSKILNQKNICLTFIHNTKLRILRRRN